MLTFPQTRPIQNQLRNLKPHPSRYLLILQQLTQARQSINSNIGDFFSQILPAPLCILGNPLHLTLKKLVMNNSTHI